MWNLNTAQNQIFIIITVIHVKKLGTNTTGQDSPRKITGSIYAFISPLFQMISFPLSPPLPINLGKNL